MDSVDQGNVLAEQHLNHALRHHMAGKEPLGEIVEGKSVICHDCRSAIDPKRVRALRMAGCPALRCIDCQRDHEHRMGKKA
jgi:RNA polymerase-binding transcription factor DksA